VTDVRVSLEDHCGTKPENILLVPYVPDSLEVRATAARAMGQTRLAAAFSTRLAQLRPAGGGASR
jgi:hypothetical protein